MDCLDKTQGALFKSKGRLNDYIVSKPIGKGKFSVVYKAQRKSDGMHVVLKKLSTFDISSSRSREKTLKEIALAQCVHHQNLIQYLDSFVAENDLYIAFEWAEAGDLKRQFRKANENRAVFDEGSIWKYFTQICAAVHYLHTSKRIMHRDLKPANIFLTKRGVLKVGDLGLGRQLSENTLHVNSKVGTPLYMSPEVLKGDAYDWKSDVWSLGCILYEFAMLRSPFKSSGLNLAGLFCKISKAEYDPIPKGLYGHKLGSLVSRMLCLNANERIGIEGVWKCCQKVLASPSTLNPSKNRAVVAAPKTKKTKRRDNDTNIRMIEPKNNAEIEITAVNRVLQRNRPSEGVDAKRALYDAEMLLDRLLVLGYRKIVSKAISIPYFAIQRPIPNLQADERFDDMCELSVWLIGLIGLPCTKFFSRNQPESQTQICQELLCFADKANISNAICHLKPQALVPAFGNSVCNFLDALSRKALLTHKVLSPVRYHDFVATKNLNEEDSRLLSSSMFTKDSIQAQKYRVCALEADKDEANSEPNKDAVTFPSKWRTVTQHCDRRPIVTRLQLIQSQEKVDRYTRLQLLRESADVLRKVVPCTQDRLLEICSASRREREQTLRKERKLCCDMKESRAICRRMSERQQNSKCRLRSIKTRIDVIKVQTEACYRELNTRLEKADQLQEFLNNSDLLQSLRLKVQQLKAENRMLDKYINCARLDYLNAHFRI